MHDACGARWRGWRVAAQAGRAAAYEKLLGEPLGLAVAAGSAGCFSHLRMLAIPAGLAAGVYLARGAARSLRWTAGLAAAGAASLGAIATHTACEMVGAYHLLLEHCSTPILAGVLLALSLALPLAHWVGRCSAPEFEA